MTPSSSTVTSMNWEQVPWVLYRVCFMTLVFPTAVLVFFAAPAGTGVVAADFIRFGEGCCRSGVEEWSSRPRIICQLLHVLLPESHVLHVGSEGDGGGGGERLLKIVRATSPEYPSRGVVQEFCEDLHYVIQLVEAIQFLRGVFDYHLQDGAQIFFLNHLPHLKLLEQGDWFCVT